MKPYKTLCIRRDMAWPARVISREVACDRTGHALWCRQHKAKAVSLATPVPWRWMEEGHAVRSVGLRACRIRDPETGQPPFPKGGKGLALEAGTVVRALFITIDNKV